MRIVLLGAPGSGKGTQAARLRAALDIAAHFHRRPVARGGQGRHAAGPEGQGGHGRGQLVSDEIVLGMLEERSPKPDARPGFILDGYPRNLAQARALEELLARIGQPLDASQD